ncbi:uncharacterized protein LAESUDRAFT_716357 [Laetiporus sulphureus 93-53]|uniref:Uncharacterized protein n=1 Tax=Laetiporus sulphureus 93-53 TaxID=1314785 RepID=A0A165CP84_9APHY|nr:uncharacterized protein LAESUDRAFT_716357 [Laetiporus sulphureus 93-53]KZT03167.1 hypothetical protein LAESUDRAFT_716357 [Laetiporus sulphureus 93-53]
MNAWNWTIEERVAAVQRLKSAFSHRVHGALHDRKTWFFAVSLALDNVPLNSLTTQKQNDGGVSEFHTSAKDAPRLCRRHHCNRHYLEGVRSRATGRRMRVRLRGRFNSESRWRAPRRRVAAEQPNWTAVRAVADRRWLDGVRALAILAVERHAKTREANYCECRHAHRLLLGNTLGLSTL